eukprot:TRINITY_DN12198_c0_g1_i1.p2 TRINITY_DN12198_c0_g1~~TRINITY_DN12198_c0_g1_i1.p2  ORF type:complete len:153 (+),score=39.85 TRINITY_DN12198_c0_g1_i1:188-646(+)
MSLDSRPSTRAERALYLGGAPGVGSRFLEPERKTTMLLGPYDNLQNRCLDMTSENSKLKTENARLAKELAEANALIAYLKKEGDLHMSMVHKEQSEAMFVKSAGDALADDAWNLRLSAEEKDKTIVELTARNSHLEDQLVGLHAMMEERTLH